MLWRQSAHQHLKLCFPFYARRFEQLLHELEHRNYMPLLRFTGIRREEFGKQQDNGT